MTESECSHMAKTKVCQKDIQNIFIFDEFDKNNEAFAYIYNVQTVL